MVQGSPRCCACWTVSISGKRARFLSRASDSRRSVLQMRWPRVEIRERVMETLDWLQIAHLKDRAPHRLSGGEKKRVALASVLVLDPEVLLLDEPTAALDPKSQSQIIDLLIGWGEGSKTVITATHDLGLVEDIADHCIILQAGRVAAEGNPPELLA